jgi:hypothetical protein
MFTRYLSLLLHFAVALFVLEYLASILAVTPQVYQGGDSFGYYIMSKTPLFSSEFWFQMRPVGYLLVLKLFDQNVHLVGAVQIALHLFTWSYFAYYLQAKSNNKVFGTLAALTVLMIGIQPEISIWASVILTESLSITLFLWIVIIAYELVETRHKKYLYLLLGLLVFYSTIRDVNAYFSLLFLLPLWLIYFFRFIGRSDILLATVVLVFAFGLSNYTANHAENPYENNELKVKVDDRYVGPRWLLPYFNVVGARFLEDQTILSFFKQEGMPINEALLRKNDIGGALHDSEGQGWYTDPDLKTYREWVLEKGKSTYVKFLLMHPEYTLGKIYQYKNRILHFDAISDDRINRLPGYRVDNIVTYSTVNNLDIYRYFLYILLALILLWAVLGRNPLNHTAGMMVLLLFLAFPIALITYHGDGGDVYRHTIIVPVLIKIPMLMLIYAMGNALLKSHQNHTP